MHRRLSENRGKVLGTIISCALVCCAGVVFASRGYRVSESNTLALKSVEASANPVNEPFTRAVRTAPSAPRGPFDDVLQVKLVTVSARGFEPKELLATSLFTLLVDDMTGLPHGIHVQLSQNNQGKEPTMVQEARIPHGQRSWIQDFELQNGEYVLTEADHPNWSCTITVSENK